MRKGPDATKIMRVDDTSSTKSAAQQTAADWGAQQLARRQTYLGASFTARLKQILTPDEYRQVEAAGLGTKATFDLPESLAVKINADPTIRALHEQAKKG